VEELLGRRILSARLVRCGDESDPVSNPVFDVLVLEFEGGLVLAVRSQDMEDYWSTLSLYLQGRRISLERVSDPDVCRGLSGE